MDEVLSESAKYVKKQLETLIGLQHVDDEINLRNDRIKRLREQTQQEEEAINHFRETTAGCKQDMEKLRKDHREIEVTNGQKSEEVKKMSGQLFEVKTNEAYSTLQSEIKQKEQENSLLEERILELMIAEDESINRLRQAEDELKHGEQQAADNQAEHKKEIGGLEKEIVDFQGQWEIAARNVKTEYLDLYKRLRTAKKGKALARIENDICTGCRLAIRPQATIELKKYRSLLCCNNCARIFYVD